MSTIAGDLVTTTASTGTLTVSQTVLQNKTLISQIVSSLIPFSQTKSPNRQSKA